jgi:hypothetical protein
MDLPAQCGADLSDVSDTSAPSSDPSTQRPSTECQGIGWKLGIVFDTSSFVTQARQVRGDHPLGWPRVASGPGRDRRFALTIGFVVG